MVLGNSGGLNYMDSNIQDSINRAFIAENDRQIAQQELEAQKIRNENTKSLADTKLYEAQKIPGCSKLAEIYDSA